MRIAVVDSGTAQWHAGSVVSWVMASALADCTQADELVDWVGSKRLGLLPPGLNGRVLPYVDPLPGERTVRRLLGRSSRESVSHREARVRHHLGMRNDADPVQYATYRDYDVILPVLRTPSIRLRSRSIGWIPDLQHRAFAEYFSPTELRQRERLVRRLLSRCAAVVVSSETVRAELLASEGRAAERVRALPFPSTLEFHMPSAVDVQALYGLPSSFALVANQFWIHKNHIVVIRALRELLDRGIRLSVVMTGALGDYREPTNRTLSEMMQEVARSGLHSQVRVLGMVPRDHLVSLLRAAAVIVQPSRYEGWNTTVQDALALRRPLVCSDIPVHREQTAGRSLEFFDADSPAELADALERALGTQGERHLDGIVGQPAPSANYGQRLLDLCRLVASGRA